MLEIQTLPMSLLEMNIGQIPEIPMNPRQWARSEVDKLARSLVETPELFEARPLLVYPHDGKFVILGGNLRYEASKANKATEVPCIVFPASTPADKLKEIVIKDNGAFGSWDFDALANEWDDLPLGDWGVPAWQLPTEGQAGGEAGGYKLDGTLAGALVDRFIVPPFSVLDTKRDYWKQRKEYWLENLLILAAMMDYGAAQGFGWYGLGCAFDENTDHENLEYDMSDSQDLIYPLARFATRKGYCAGFKTWLFTTTHSYHIIYRLRPELMDLVATCVTPDYRKPNIYRANVRRYGEGLILPNRCGTCYKCAEEYVQRVRLGLVRCNQDYYIKSIHGRDAFKKNYIPDFPLDKGTNTWGGQNRPGIQVLSDRVGYFIGRLRLDPGLHKWFPDRFYGRRHWQDRAHAEAVLRRFLALYKLETIEKPSGA